MARTCAGRESVPIRRAGDRRRPDLRRSAVPAAGGRCTRRAEAGDDAGSLRDAEAGCRAETGDDPGSLRDAEAGCRAETGDDAVTLRVGEGGGACRRGLLVLTLVLAGAAAAAQPLVSPADEAALRGLLPDADHFELHDRGPRHFRAFAAAEAGAAPRLIGLAFFTTDLAPRIYAYKGRITSLVAMDPGGRLIGVQVVHHYEPFGYFSIDLPGFTPQFAGKSILEPLEVGGDIDAVSRATITMEAATRAIRQGARRLARDFLAEQSADR